MDWTDIPSLLPAGFVTMMAVLLLRLWWSERTSWVERETAMELRWAQERVAWQTERVAMETRWNVERVAIEERCARQAEASLADWKRSVEFNRERIGILEAQIERQETQIERLESQLRDGAPKGA